MGEKKDKQQKETATEETGVKPALSAKDQYLAAKRAQREEAAVEDTLKTSGLKVRYVPVDMSAMAGSGQLPTSLLQSYVRAEDDRRGKGQRDPLKTDALIESMTGAEIIASAELVRRLVVENTLFPEIKVTATGVPMFDFGDGELVTIDPVDFTELRQLIMGKEETEQTAGLKQFRKEQPRAAGAGGEGGS